MFARVYVFDSASWKRVCVSFSFFFFLLCIHVEAHVGERRSRRGRGERKLRAEKWALVS